jgi:hypothetical protein
METLKKKFLIIASVLALIIACEKDVLNNKEDFGDDPSLKQAMVEDTTLETTSDIVIEDTILQNYAFISQYFEDYLTYTYDRAGRLAYVNYVKRNIISPVSTSDVSARYVYMRDKFVYGNTGRLMELERYNLTYNSAITSLVVKKSYRYNKEGQLVSIITCKPSSRTAWEKVEYLYYDELGNMVEKIIKDPYSGLRKLIYSYDKENRLIRIAGYIDNRACLYFICDLFYDSRDNIERKEFYYPAITAASVNDVIRKWNVYYRYDDAYNPFKDLKLPVSSLFEWMDVISPSNITAISFDNNTVNKVVFYRYRYNSHYYPVLRYRVNLLPIDD